MMVINGTSRSTPLSGGIRAARGDTFRRVTEHFSPCNYLFCSVLKLSTLDFFFLSFFAYFLLLGYTPYIHNQQQHALSPSFVLCSVLWGRAVCNASSDDIFLSY